ncbi:type VII secretion protein EccE [Nocardia sp. CC227C]|uniref:type VII secretion protein EccE n=1 Tax=Nocardia sp. CC227C TaxID=3044562 RepID=UPI00278BE059|nr:type VII secretion protein EccE [Nocardia sp. CC227C]
MSGGTVVNDLLDERETGDVTADGGRPPTRRDSAPPEPARLGTDELWLFRMLPLRLVIPVALLAATASVVAVAVDAPWWAILIAAALPALIGLTPVRGIPIGLRLGGWIAFRWRQSRRRPPAEASLIDVPLPEGGSYGLRWDGTLLTTMLRIDSPPDSLTLLRRGSLSTDQVLPLTEIARCLRQFDIELDSIDVISTGTRTAGSEAVLSGYASSVAPLVRMYEEILGPLPAIAHRTVWLVLRLNPLATSKAVDNRGGGAVGTLRAAAIATRRVANRLAAQGITASVLTSSEMTSALRELIRGIPVAELEETPTALIARNTHLTSYQVGSEMITTDGLAMIWAVPSLATTLTVRLRPLAGKDTRTDAIEVDARVRYDTVRELDSPPVAGLQELRQRQMWALLDSLPFGDRESRALTYRGPVDALAGALVPTGGCGQLIGADGSGSGIAVPLIGSGSRRIDIIGSLPLAQQVILRAIALGAGAVVHTARPAAWQDMVANVGAPHALALASSITGNARHSTSTARAPHPAATVVVFDGVPSSAPSGSATVVTVLDAPPRDWQPDADVTIIQDPDSPYTVTVRTPATTTTAQLVTTPTEQRFIGSAYARR